MKLPKPQHLCRCKHTIGWHNRRTGACFWCRCRRYRVKLPAGKRVPATPAQRLREIADILEDVDRRCMAADGNVTPTRQEIGDDELRRIYRLAIGPQRARRRTR